VRRRVLACAAVKIAGQRKARFNKSPARSGAFSLFGICAAVIGGCRTPFDRGSIRSATCWSANCRTDSWACSDCPLRRVSP